jgi:hypothetical protein
MTSVTIATTDHEAAAKFFANEFSVATADIQAAFPDQASQDALYGDYEALQGHYRAMEGSFAGSGLATIFATFSYQAIDKVDHTPIPYIVATVLFAGLTAAGILNTVHHGMKTRSINTRLQSKLATNGPN